MKLQDLYSQWCKDTKRNGSVLVGSSIKEFFEWLDARYVVNVSEKTGHPDFFGVKLFELNPTTYEQNLNKPRA